MSKLTEKLGIKPIQGFNVYTDDVDNGGGRCCYESEVRKLEQQNTDMLKELIKSIGIDMGERGCNQPYECDYLKGSNCINPCYTYERIKLIEKVAEMPWHNIKQLIGE